jgi:hypothetical protein
MKNFRYYEKGQRIPMSNRHAGMVEWPHDPDEFCCQAEASDGPGDPWLCTLLTDFPHTLHEAGVGDEIAATWED